MYRFILASLLVVLASACDGNGPRGGEAPRVEALGPIPDTTTYSDSAPVEVLVKLHFESNQAAGVVTYQAEVSDLDVVAAEALQRGAVLLTPGQPGRAEVTARARGSEGGDASITFDVTVLGSCPAGPESGETDLFPHESGMRWRFEAEEVSYGREFRDSYRGEWTLTLGDAACAQGVRAATFAAAFVGEKGTPHPDLGTVWSPFVFEESLAFIESAEGVTIVLPGIVSGAHASFERYSTASELEVLTEEEGRGSCLDTATFVAGVGLERRSFSCYYGMGWGESTQHQRR